MSLLLPDQRIGYANNVVELAVYDSNLWLFFHFSHAVDVFVMVSYFVTLRNGNSFYTSLRWIEMVLS